MGKVAFSRVRKNGFGDRSVDVFHGGERVGELYRDEGMPRWAGDAGVEEIFGENVADGWDTLAGVKSALRKAEPVRRGNRETLYGVCRSRVEAEVMAREAGAENTLRGHVFEVRKDVLSEGWWNVFEVDRGV